MVRESNRHGNACNQSTGKGPRFVSVESLRPLLRRSAYPSHARPATASQRARCGPRASVPRFNVHFCRASCVRAAVAGTGKVKLHDTFILKTRSEARAAAVAKRMSVCSP